MKKTVILFLLAIILIPNTLSAQRIPKNYQKKYTLAILEKVGTNLYFDNRDIVNVDWLEYMYWLEKVYGKESPEFQASIPDTTIMRQQLSDSLAKYYKWKAPGYRLFPIWGVSNEQAKAYCAWRSDRIAEHMLSKMKFIEYNPKPTPENFFTLSKYDAPEGLEFLIFSLGNDNTETRYGFRCYAQWKKL